MYWPHETKKRALFHPAAQQLLSYAIKGYPTECGANWTLEEIQTAITRAPHPSAKKTEAALAFHTQALERVTEGCCRIVKWDDIKHKPPANLKISPIAAIPHKSRQFRMILDLSFELKVNQSCLNQSKVLPTKLLHHMKPCTN